MTFTYFLIGLILLYIVYYAVIVLYDINKAKKKRVDSGDEYTAIDIDEEEFAPQMADEVYTYETEKPAVDQSSHSSKEKEEYEPIVETHPEENEPETIEKPSVEESQPVVDKTEEVQPLSREEESVVKYNSNLTNHGGMGIPALKSLIKEASGEENMFGEIACLFS